MPPEAEGPVAWLEKARRDLGVGPRYPGWDVMVDAVEPDAVLEDARTILQAVERHVAASTA